MSDRADPVPGARHVEIVHASRLQKLDLVAWLAAIPVFGLGGVLSWMTYPWEQIGMVWATGILAAFAAPAAMALLTVAMPLITHVMRGHHYRGMRVITDDDALCVIPRTGMPISVAWSEIGVAWIREPRVVELATARGDELTIVFDSPEGAAHFVALVRSRARGRRAYPLALEADWVRASRKSVATVVPSIFATTAFAAGPIGLPVVTLSLGVSYLGARGSRRLELGADGVVLHRRHSKRYVPYRDIARVELASSVFGARSLALVLEDGERVSLGALIGRRRAELAKALLDEGIRMAHDGAAAGAEVASLARQESESEDGWRERVLAAARRSGYRGPALDAETLIALMRNPAADAEQRVAAALAMRASPAGVARIRVAAQVSTEPDVREALEALGEEEVDELRFSRALRKLATAKRP